MDALHASSPRPPDLPFRLAAIDLDGTLLGPDKTLGEENRAAVQRLQAAGCRVILASGRRHQNSIRFQRELDLHGPIIACQGGLIRDGETGDVQEAQFLSSTLANAVVDEGTRLDVNVIYYHLDHLYVGSHRDDFLDLYERRVGEQAEVLPNLGSLGGKQALKIVWYADPALLRSKRAGLSERFRDSLDVLSTEDENLEFMPPGVNKASALEKVARRFGLSAPEVLAFGDGENDVPMLRWAGVGVAMAHGNELAKRAAARVSPPGPRETAFARAVDALFDEAAGADPRSR